MGRKAKAVRRDWVWYAPKIDDNRNDPEPFEIEIRPLSAGELQALEAEQMKLSKEEIASLTKDEDLDFGAKGRAMVRRMFETSTRGVRGYAIGDTEVDTGAEMYRLIMEIGDEKEKSIIDDVAAAIRSASHLEAGVLDRSSLQSDSSTQGTPRLSGGAASDAGDGTQQARSTTQHEDRFETATRNPTTASHGNGLRL